MPFAFLVFFAILRFLDHFWGKKRPTLHANLVDKLHRFTVPTGSPLPRDFLARGLRRRREEEKKRRREEEKKRRREEERKRRKEEKEQSTLPQTTIYIKTPDQPPVAALC